MEAKSRVIAAWAIMVALLLGSVPLPAKARKGARVVVERNDGISVSGELLMVKTDCLVIGGPGGGMIVGLGEVRSVRIVKKSKAGTGLLVGLLGGTLIGTVINGGGDGCNGPMFEACMMALFVGLPAGGLGAMLGVVLGKDSILEKDKVNPISFQLVLNRHARAPGAASFFNR